MQIIHSPHSKEFLPPAAEPVFAVKSLVFLTLNILTLGIYGTAETLSKKHQFKELKIEQESLVKQANDLSDQWNTLEKNLTSLLEQFSSLNPSTTDQIELKDRIQSISKQKEQLKNQKVHPHQETSANLTEIALGTIAFLGQLMANLFTVGLYGVYQNYTLKNRINYLVQQNAHIQEKFNDEKKLKADCIQKIIDLVESHIKAREELIAIRKTDIGQAYTDMTSAKKETEALQAQQADLQTRYVALEAQQVVIESEKEFLTTKLKTVTTNLVDAETRRLHEQEASWVVIKENKVLQQNMIQTEEEITNLRAKVRDLDLKANRVRELESQVSALQNAAKNQHILVKESVKLGSVEPLYTPRKEDGVVKGAIEIQKDLSVAPSVRLFAQEYVKRYENLRTATEVVKVTFDYAFDSLLHMANTGNKIKLNASDETYLSSGAHAVYNFMALSLIKGGKVYQPIACEPVYSLAINPHVIMVPSQPERVMRCESKQEGMEPKVVINYRRRDDFTPSPEELKLPHGVDSVSVQWILKQLSETEEEHLFNLLMRSLIENDHPDYEETREFMQKGNPDRVKLIRTACDLISDIGDAISKKCIPTLFDSTWEIKADQSIPAFVKVGDENIDPKTIPDETPEIAIMEWKLDPDVLGNKNKKTGLLQQPEFYTLIENSYAKYQAAFSCIDADLIEYPNNSTKINALRWDDISSQYYVSHEMINSVDGTGGPRCLFSNLLAILLDDKQHLTEENVNKLRKGMAAYLDKIQDAKRRYEILNKYSQTQMLPEDVKLKELAEQAESFEKTIQEIHHCTVDTYQAWLRKENVKAAKINLEQLSDFEIQLCAYTIGVEIGLLIIQQGYSARIDKYKKIVPTESRCYGPKTKASLLMGLNKDSYYGLFPKLKLLDRQALKINNEEYNNLMHLQNYWATLDLIKGD